MADRIPWDEFEIKYASLFPSGTGNVAKPLRMALGALIIRQGSSMLTVNLWNRLRKIRIRHLSGIPMMILQKKGTEQQCGLEPVLPPLYGLRT